MLPEDPYAPDSPYWDPNAPGTYVPPPAGQNPPPTGNVPAYNWVTDPNHDPGPEYFWNGGFWEHQGTATSGGVGSAGPINPPLTPPATGGGGGGGGIGGGVTGGGGYGYSGATEGPPDFNAPRWQTPPEFVYNKQFQAPTAETLYQDPSFQFRMDQGRKALEQSAAGKGVLRTGGTLKDLVNYGQNLATTEYGNVYNRKFNEYKFDYDKEADTYAKNYGLKRDVFDRNYRAAYDEYAPKLRGWESKFNRDWQKYIADRGFEQEDWQQTPYP